MPEESTPPIPMNVGQAQAMVEYVENPQNPTGVGLWLWAHYYQAKIYLLQSHLPLSDKIRYTHLYQHPRALTAVEFEQYLAREVEYLEVGELAELRRQRGQLVVPELQPLEVGELAELCGQHGQRGLWI